MTEGIHIRHKEHLWVVERGNYLLGEFKTQEQAIQMGRKRAKASQAELLIHSEDGSIQREESFQELPKYHAISDKTAF